MVSRFFTIIEENSLRCQPSSTPSLPLTPGRGGWWWFGARGGGAETTGISDWEEMCLYNGQEVLTKILLKRNNQFGMTSTPMSCAYISRLALIPALSCALSSLCALVCLSSERHLTHNPLLTIPIIPWDVQFKMTSDSVARIKHLCCTISGTRHLHTALGILCRCRSRAPVWKSIRKTKKRTKTPRILTSTHEVIALFAGSTDCKFALLNLWLGLSRRTGAW